MQGCFRCPNGGVCSAPDHCSCAEGWTGYDCRTPVCEVSGDGWAGHDWRGLCHCFRHYGRESLRMIRTYLALTLVLPPNQSTDVVGWSSSPLRKCASNIDKWGDVNDCEFSSSCFWHIPWEPHGSPTGAPRQPHRYPIARDPWTTRGRPIEVLKSLWENRGSPGEPIGTHMRPMGHQWDARPMRDPRETHGIPRKSRGIHGRPIGAEG